MIDEPTVITHDVGDRRMRVCRCSSCGIQRLCTPTFDFYAKRKDPRVQDGGPLQCEACFRAGLEARGINTSWLEPFDN